MEVQLKQVFMHKTGEAVQISNIFCIGRNYAAHIAELGNKRTDEPVVFLKPTSALNTEENLINLPSFSNEIHYETELVILVGKQGKQIKAEDALEYIAGYGVGLDLTARDLQSFAKERGLPWTLAKGFDSAACISRFILPSDLGDPNNCEFEMKQNGIVRQRGNTSFMIFNIEYLICYLSNMFTLYPGDLIFTGTPEGAGKINSGDRLELNLADKISATFSVA